MYCVFFCSLSVWSHSERRHVSSEVMALVRCSDLYSSETLLSVGFRLCLNSAQYAVSFLIRLSGSLFEVFRLHLLCDILLQSAAVHDHYGALNRSS